MRSAQALLPNRAYHCFSLIADKTAVKQLFRMMQKHNIKDIVSPPHPTEAKMNANQTWKTCLHLPLPSQFNSDCENIQQYTR